MCDLCWQPTAMFRCDCGLMPCPPCANEHERTHTNKEAVPPQAPPEPGVFTDSGKNSGR